MESSNYFFCSHSYEAEDLKGPLHLVHGLGQIRSLGSSLFIKLTRRYKIKQSSGSQRPAEKKFQNSERKPTLGRALRGDEPKINSGLGRIQNNEREKSVSITWPSARAKAKT